MRKGFGFHNRHSPIRENLGPELVTNGNFSGGATGWTKIGNITIGGGVAAFTGGAASTLYQTGWTLTTGRKYRVTVTVTSVTAAGNLTVYFGSTNQVAVPITTPGTFSLERFPSGDNIVYLQTTSPVILSIDDVSVREVI
jgi:hypothetical protein